MKLWKIKTRNNRKWKEKIMRFNIYPFSRLTSFFISLMQMKKSWIWDLRAHYAFYRLVISHLVIMGTLGVMNRNAITWPSSIASTKASPLSSDFLEIVLVTLIWCTPLSHWDFDLHNISEWIYHWSTIPLEGFVTMLHSNLGFWLL